MNVATSLGLAAFAVLLFSALWLTSMWLGGCPRWFEIIGLPCDIFVGVSYFAVCPALALSAVIVSVRDIVRKQRRAQAVVAVCVAASLLVWLWANPPH